jgi:hypothetical protein
VALAWVGSPSKISVADQACLVVKATFQYMPLLLLLPHEYPSVMTICRLEVVAVVVEMSGADCMPQLGRHSLQREVSKALHISGLEDRISMLVSRSGLGVLEFGDVAFGVSIDLRVEQNPV